MKTHTPGPWIAEDRPPNMTIVFAGVERGRRLAPCILLADDDQEANARLIAAAPDMLDALKAIIAAAETGFPEALAQARSAIAKAEPPA